MSDTYSALIIDGERRLSHLVACALAHAPGVRVHALSTEPRATLRFSRYRTSVHLARHHLDPEPRLRAIIETVRRTGADVVLGVAEEPIRFLSEHRAAIQRHAAVVAVPTVAQAEQISDKRSLAVFAHGAGLPMPRTLLGSEVIAGQRPDGLDGPVLIKPAAGEGGRGIIRADSLGSAAAMLHDLPPERAEDVVVQEYLPGRDIDCSVLCRDGRVIASATQRPIAAGASIYAPPRAIEFVHDERAEALAGQWAATIGWNGVAHLDLREDADGRVRLIEINPRYWTSLLGSLMAGINFPDLACREALGLALPDPHYADIRHYDVGVALRRLVAPATGSSRTRTGQLEARPKVFAETAASYRIKDPVAELLHQTRQSRWWKRVRPHRGASASRGATPQGVVSATSAPPAARPAVLR